MKLFILSGSHRQKSQSERVAKFIEGRWQSLFPNHPTDFYSLAGNPLPLWDEQLWESGPTKWNDLWAPVKKRLESSEAVVLVTPEWAGMASPGVKNFLILASGQALAHKPIYLVGVSAARGGAYPVAELRMMAHKNNGACFIPEHLIVRQVESVFGPSVSGEDDAYLRGRLDYGLRLLESYGHGLKTVRESGVVDFKHYPNGM